MTMKNKDILINNILKGFQDLRGRASVYCFTKDIIPELVYNIVNNFFNKYRNENVLIVVDKYENKKAIVDYLNKHNINKYNNYNINFISADYIKFKYHYCYKLIITVALNEEYITINHLFYGTKFMLSILTENKMNNDFIKNLRMILPNIEVDDYTKNIKFDTIYSPVEEHRIKVELSEEDKKLYDKYSEYITTSITIFGELNNIEKCKHGDKELNISSAEFRNNIAKQNGWKEDLDTNIEFYKQIDDIYNPNILYERACNFYNIAKQRRDLVTDNIIKLDSIINICNDNKNKKIVIVSKKGEFAAKITKYINEKLGNICGDYHDCIEDAIAIDNNGIPIKIKSGPRKGEYRIVKSQAQSTANERRFNNNDISILSIKQSSNVELKIACDIVIFTSSLCDNIIEFKTRFNNIKFNNSITETYRIYCDNTIEKEQFSREKLSNAIKIIENEDNLVYDENSGNIIL